MTKKDAIKNREAKRCDVCGCRLWLHDSVAGGFRGPYHFEDCISVPGGAELCVANAEDRRRWLSEKYVPKPQAARILEAILLMLASPSQEIKGQRKAAILAELRSLQPEAETVIEDDVVGDSLE